MAQTLGERLARVEEQVAGLGKLITSNHESVTEQLKGLTKTVENGKLANYRITEIEDKVESLDKTTSDLWGWREKLNGKIAMLLGVIGALIVAVQVVAAFV